jgi:hypothetical protein
MISHKILLAAAAAALMSTPALAQADHGRGHHDGAEVSEQSKDEGGKGKGSTDNHKCLPHKVAYVASGTLVSESLTRDGGSQTYSGTVSVEITHTNHHAAADDNKTITYELTKVSVVFGLADTNNDGTVGLDDLAKGDRVRLIGKITAIAKHCTQEFTPTKTIRHIVFHAPISGSKGKS